MHTYLRYFQQPSHHSEPYLARPGRTTPASIVSVLDDVVRAAQSTPVL